MKKLIITLLITTTLFFKLFAQEKGNQYFGKFDADSTFSNDELVITPESAATPLPFMVDNSQQPYMPPVLDQVGYSCAHASAIGYMFTYEANRFRNEVVDSVKDWENIYPPGFTYNFINEGSQWTGSSFSAALDLLESIGIPRASDYEEDHYLKCLDAPTVYDSLRWKSGYDYYKNKVLVNKPDFSRYQVSKSADTTMIWKMKHWLNDHNAGDTVGGAMVFAAKMVWADPRQGILPPESYDAGKRYVIDFSPTGGHGLTVIGYNDSVMVDYDSNGIFTNDVDINGDGDVNVMDWEKGAFKVVNSNGFGYADSGYIYVPYRLFALPSGPEGGTGVLWLYLCVIDRYR